MYLLILAMTVMTNFHQINSKKEKKILTFWPFRNLKILVIKCGIFKHFYQEDNLDNLEMLVISHQTPDRLYNETKEHFFLFFQILLNSNDATSQCFRSHEDPSQ